MHTIYKDPGPNMSRYEPGLGTVVMVFRTAERTNPTVRVARKVRMARTCIFHDQTQTPHNATLIVTIILMLTRMINHNHSPFASFAVSLGAFRILFEPHQSFGSTPCDLHSFDSWIMFAQTMSKIVS